MVEELQFEKCKLLQTTGKYKGQMRRKLFYRGKRREFGGAVIKMSISGKWEFEM